MIVILFILFNVVKGNLIELRGVVVMPYLWSAASTIRIICTLVNPLASGIIVSMPCVTRHMNEPCAFSHFDQAFHIPLL